MADAQLVGHSWKNFLEKRDAAYTSLLITPLAAGVAKNNKSTVW
jgi:hypothetical protein